MNFVTFIMRIKNEERKALLGSLAEDRSFANGFEEA
jgi:hypothetical protein